jgi:single-stranded DNA-specific DHH superfamily exonuclease
MRFKNKALINRFKKFITSITPKDRVAVIHHTDPDGVCSGVIIAKVIERVRGKKIDLRHNQKGNVHVITPETFKLLKSRKINKLILTDLGADENPKFLKKIEKFADILIIDHHKIYNNLSSKKTVFIKPQLICGIDPARYSASKLCYDLSMLVTIVSDLDWLAAVGSIGDIAVKPWTAWLNRVFKRHKIKKQKDLFKTKLGQCAILISSAESFDVKNVKLAFDVLYNARSYKNVLRSKLKNFRKKIDDEIQKYLKQLKKHAFFEKDIIYYEIKPKYHTKSPLCTILGQKYPHNSVFVVDISRNPVGISGRRSDVKIKINKALEDACRGIPNASAGGHAVSAGATVPKKYYEKFKTRLFNILKKKRR